MSFPCLISGNSVLETSSSQSQKHANGYNVPKELTVSLSSFSQHFSYHPWHFNSISLFLSQFVGKCKCKWNKQQNLRRNMILVFLCFFFVCLLVFLLAKIKCCLMQVLNLGTLIQVNEPSNQSLAEHQSAFLKISHS